MTISGGQKFPYSKFLLSYCLFLSILPTSISYSYGFIFETVPGSEVIPWLTDGGAMFFSLFLSLNLDGFSGLGCVQPMIYFIMILEK